MGSFIQLLLKIQVLRFLLVGTLGFITDASLLHMLRHLFGIICARAISISVAIILTWVLNRQFTFRSHDPHYSSEWLRYLLVYSIGISLNFSIFSTLIRISPTLYRFPVGALARVNASNFSQKQ